MEIGCVGSSSTTSSCTRPPSSQQSSRPSSDLSGTSSQASSQQSNGHVPRPRSALNSAYGALRKLVTRKGSKGKDHPAGFRPITPNGPEPLLESDDSSSNEAEKLKRQCRNRYDRPSRKVTSSHTSTSQSPPPPGSDHKSNTASTSKTVKTQGNSPKKKDVNGEAVGGGLSQTITRRQRERRAAAVKESARAEQSSSSNESMLSDISDADILAARGIMLKRKLGEGTYAKVRSGYHTRLQRPGYVAIKIISRETTNQRYQTKFLPRERAILDRVKHRNIIRLHETFECGQKVGPTWVF